MDCVILPLNGTLEFVILYQKIMGKFRNSNLDKLKNKEILLDQNHYIIHQKY